MRLEPRRTNRSTLRSRRLRAGGALCVAAATALVTGCGQSADSSTSAVTSEAAKVLPQKTATPSAGAKLTQAQLERKKVLSATKVTFTRAATTAVGEVAGGKLVELDLEGLDDESARPSASASTSASASASVSVSASVSASAKASASAKTSASASVRVSGSARPSGTGSASASPGATGPVWVAEVAEKNGTIHVVRINAVNGKVIDARVDADQDADEKRETAQWLAKATQTPQQAAKVATEKKKGTVTSVDLGYASKRVVWSVDVVGSDWKKTTFDVDAKNDTIVREQTDKN
ncbi:PepSY domain-containing protein [Streptomyces sp. ADI96-02]|uniref:PepSY domain-containing protein n=1 Tax=Streptomyces sp. ADI96-02 TaxID=1522760 RepID=UPI000F557C14|nr:PepSY domain-containing protein [Streptomyces sp. ADI96-02]